MSFLDLAKKRYSARKYKSKEVEKEKIDLILEAARVAPTGANRQPQRIIIVNDKKYLEKLSKATKFFDAPLVFIICCDNNETWTRSYDGKKLTDIDTSIVTDHMMLQATDIGLDSVWICRFEPEILKKEFNIPNHIEPVNILAVGYGDCEKASSDRHSTARKDIKDTIIYNSF